MATISASGSPIHMNGRVYDPIIGRFLSADPFIQAPFNSQSYNRYSYVWNNPLSASDPSGFVMMRFDDSDTCEDDPDGCSNRAKFEKKKCEFYGLDCEFKKDAQGQWRGVGTTDSLVTLATARSAGVIAGYVEPASQMSNFTSDAEPDGIMEDARNTELGLEMVDGKLTGEIVWGCAKSSMSKCEKIVNQFNVMNAESEFLDIKNTLVVDNIKVEARIIFFNNGSTSLVGRWNNQRKILWYNTAYGINKRVSWHEYGHAIGLYHLENRSRNFMSYYGTGTNRSNVIYRLSGHQQYWLRNAYTPWYQGVLEWFN